MDLNRLTEKSQEALRQAHTIATQRSHQGVDMEHIFSALIAPPEGIVPAILGQADVPLARLQEEVELVLARSSACCKKRSRRISDDRSLQVS